MTEYLPVALLLLLLSLGVPIAYALATAGLLGLSLVSDWNTASNMLVVLPHRVVANYVLISIPMFLFFGYLAESTGIIAGTFEAAKRWLGRMPGGLAIATTSASGAFAAASGSSISSCVIFGSLAIPEMRKAGYSREFSMGLVASAGLLASTIPPSLTMILYGMLSETSIIKLFTAGVIPGILQMGVIIATVMLLYIIRRQHFPAGADTRSTTTAEKFASLRGVWPLLAVAIAILASIYTGIATVTESASAGVAMALLIASFKGRLSWAVLREAASKTCHTTAMILAILVGGLIFSTYIGMTDIATDLLAMFRQLPLNGTGVLLALIPVFLLLGCFLDGASILVLSVPLLLPIARHYNIDLLLLGIYLTFCIELGGLTPPVGINVFAVKGTVPDGTLEEAFRGMLPFFFLMLGLLVVLVCVPELVTWLPSQGGGG